MGGSQAVTAVAFLSMLPPAKIMMYSQRRDTDSAALLLQEISVLIHFFTQNDLSKAI